MAALPWEVSLSSSVQGFERPCQYHRPQTLSLPDRRISQKIGGEGVLWSGPAAHMY